MEERIKELKEKLAKNSEVYFNIKVRPNSDATSFRDLMADDTLKLSIKAQAENGEANKELIKFLAKDFSVSRDDIKIISGAGDRKKLLKIKI